MKVPAGSAGTFLVVRIVTNFSWPAAAGRPVYLNDRRPVALQQQVPGDHGRPIPAARDGEHIPIPDPSPRFAARPSVGASVPVAAASATSPDQRRGPRSAA